MSQICPWQLTGLEQDSTPIEQSSQRCLEQRIDLYGLLRTLPSLVGPRN
jgi:hypothetical protein